MYDPDYRPCLFTDICEEECDGCTYSSLEDYYDWLIEEGRIEYRNEWWQYLEDNESSYYFYPLNTI